MTTTIKTSSQFCALLLMVFERHKADGTLKHVRPWRGGKYRDGLAEQRIGNRILYQLWYEVYIPDCKLPQPFSSRMVQIESECKAS